MLSRSTIKHINSLKIKKYRQQHQSFIVEGEKSVAELLAGTLDIVSILCTESWLIENRERLEGIKTEVSIVTETELDKISDLTTPNKVLSIVAIPPVRPLNQEDFGDLILALDGIRDPGNMGTILRTADWFGISNVVCSPDSVDVYNSKVVQSSMGSFARVNVHYTELSALIQFRPQGTPVYGAILEGPLLTDKKIYKPGILLIGNESRGISESLIPYITDPIHIPRFSGKASGPYHAESLNVSVANAIICYEIRKQLSENKF